MKNSVFPAVALALAVSFCFQAVWAETTIVTFEPTATDPIVYATNESSENLQFNIGDFFQNADKTKNYFYGNPHSDGTIYQSSLYGTSIYFDAGANLSNNYAFTPAAASWTGQDSDSWDGFAVSQANDTTTAGYGNQYSVCTGGGYNGSSTFAVGFYSAWNSTEDLSNCYIDLTGADVNGVGLKGFFVTNTTYAYQSMAQGDSFSKQFSQADGDWLKLVIRGIDAEGSVVQTKDFYLAGFGSTNDPETYEWRILDDWQWVDLDGWNDIALLDFTLDSSDVGEWGMNTPAYFAVDNLTWGTEVYVPPVDPGADVRIPEPSSWALLFLGLAGLAGIRYQFRQDKRRLQNRKEAY